MHNNSAVIESCQLPCRAEDVTIAFSCVENGSVVVTLPEEMAEDIGISQLRVQHKHFDQMCNAIKAPIRKPNYKLMYLAGQSPISLHFVAMPDGIMMRCNWARPKDGRHHHRAFPLYTDQLGPVLQLQAAVLNTLNRPSFGL